MLSYVLPQDKIAQTPLADRTASKLVVASRYQTSGFIQTTVADVGRFFREGDVLVLNTSRVFSARLLVQRPSGAEAECFFLRQADS